jgi:hypothetical protein
MSGSDGEATGVIAELLAEAVGFSAGWGLSRELQDLGGELLTAAGNVDGRALAARAEAALTGFLATPPANSTEVPEGAAGFAPELCAGVAVSQCCSGWAPLPGKPSGGRRLVALRCHAGKRREARGLANAVLLQYRVWTRRGSGAPRQVTEAAQVRSLVEDVHAEIVRALS